MTMRTDDDLKNLCTCGGPAYECAHCNERRCMECNEVSMSEEIKTAVRWCPTHHEDGRMGRLIPTGDGWYKAVLPIDRSKAKAFIQRMDGSVEDVTAEVGHCSDCGDEYTGFHACQKFMAAEDES